MFTQIWKKLSLQAKFKNITLTRDFLERFEVWVEMQCGISLRLEESELEEEVVSTRRILHRIGLSDKLTVSDSRLRPEVTNVKPCVSMATPVRWTCSSMYLLIFLIIFK